MQFNKKELASMLTAMFLIGVIATSSFVLAAGISQTHVISAGVYPGAPSFTVWGDGTGNYYAKNAYGALAYSGADASAVIQAALNGLTAGRTWKEKVVLTGDLHLRSMLNIPSYTTLEIDGKLVMGAGTFWAILYATSANHIDIAGGILDRGAATLDNAILFEDVYESSIIGVKVTHGIDIRASDTIVVKNNRVSYKGISIGYESNRCIVEGNYVLSVESGHGIVISGGAGPCWGNKVVNNHVDGVSAGLGITVDQGSYRNTIASNTVINTSGDAINGEDSVFENVYIGNIIYAGRLAIAGSATTRCYNNKVIGNTIIAAPIDALYIYYADWTQVTGNLIFNSNQKGIAVFQSTNTQVIGNSIRQNSATQCAIYNCATSPNTSIMNNDVTGNTLKIYSASPDTIIKGNIGYVTENFGTATFSGTGTQKAFTILHGLAGTCKTIVVTAGSSDAKGDFYVTHDMSTFTVHYETAPPSGTDNVVLCWRAEM